jgi:hypothetical protein
MTREADHDPSMSSTSKETWQKLAESWVGISPRDEHFDAWMTLNLHPPLQGHVPEEWRSRLESDPRATSFLQRQLRSNFRWESTWVDWMPNNHAANWLLGPRENLERTILLAGAICCRELIAHSIAKTIRTALLDTLGSEVLQRLSSRPALAKIPVPPAARPLAWALDPAQTLRRSGLICLRIAAAPFPVGMEARLAAILPDPVWTDKALTFADTDSERAMEILLAGKQLDYSLSSL